MTARDGLALIALLLVVPAYGQQSNAVPRVPSSGGTPAPASNAVPMTPGQAATTLIEGASQVQERARDAVNAGIDIRELQGGKVDPRLGRFMGKANIVGDLAGTVVEGQEIYREYGSEGMEVFRWVRSSELAMDTAVDLFAPEVAPAWHLSRRAGEIIRQIPLPWVGRTIEDMVTDLYFDNLHGRKVNEAFERNTSDEAIERHRQKLRRERFETMSRSNEQAAANRATISAQQAESENAAAMSQMMLNLLPAAIAASQPPIRPPLAAPPTVASPLPELQYRQRCTSDGRRLGTGEMSPTHCWQEPVYPGSAPPAQPRIELPSLGSTFGSPPTQTNPSYCPPGYKPCSKNLECNC